MMKLSYVVFSDGKESGPMGSKIRCLMAEAVSSLRTESRQEGGGGVRKKDSQNDRTKNYVDSIMGENGFGMTFFLYFCMQGEFY